jgi:Bacterial Ig-like domain (group 2)/IPT/TIG domain
MSGFADSTVNGRRVALMAALSVVVVLACKDNAGVDLQKVASVTLIPATVDLDALGATQEMTATARDALGNILASAEVTWGTDDGMVATVDGAGMVKAVGPGTTEVTVMAGSITRSSTVNVVQVPAGLVVVSGDAQSSVVASDLPAPLVVGVTDRLGSAATGVTVNFKLTKGSGTLSAASVPADADGHASTELTLGTAAGEYQVTVTLSVSAAGTAVFTATGLPDQPTAASAAGGDAQLQPASSTLPSPLVVRVVDQYGNGVPGEQVTFSVTAGGGSVNPTSATSDAMGDARTTWSLGATVGPQSVEAVVASLTGGPIAFSATGTDLAIATITPNPLVQGQPATITGTGFDAAVADNAVTVGGLTATITNASPTSLDVIVPTAGCRPAGPTSVVVSAVSGGTTPGFSTDFTPAPLVNLAVGEMLLLEDPNDFCLHFDAQAANQEYLFGVQAVSDVGNALTEVHITALTPAGLSPAIAALPAMGRAAGPGQGARPLSARELRWQRHREAETDLRQRAEAAVRAARRTGPSNVAASFGRSAAIPATVQVGDIVSLRMPDLSANICDDFLTISAVVKAVGTRGIWLNDRDNPGNGFSDIDFQNLSNQLDNGIYDTDVSYFGDPTDLDGNQRIVILVTEKINDVDTQNSIILGFVSPGDVLPALCTASNGAEIYYNRAPEPQGYTRDLALEDAPELIAHEFTHVIQTGHRLVMQQNGDFMAAFVAEAQATFAEEVVGHDVTGRSTGQNYGYAIALNDPHFDPVSWYADQFADLSFYFGRNQNDPATPIADTPARCSWVTNSPSPCQGRALWYGVGWSFLRWISDNYGSQLGGEQQFQRDLIDNNVFGFDNIEDVTGIPIETLLAKWAASLYLDDRGVAGLAPDLTIPSWNFKDVFEDGQLPASAALEPAPLTFGDYTKVTRVRSSSTAYFLLGGMNRPATSIRVRNPSDGTLASFMQIFLVRTN